jgi:hypothetical protein
MQKTVNVVGCGGFGIKNLNLPRKQPIAGAEYSPYYIDTSASDLAPGQPRDNVYLIPNCDGSGKLPQLNYEKIVQAMPDIVTKFQPAEINIIVFSLSGGSGNTIAMQYAEACWREGKEVVLFAIGSREDMQALTNVRNMIANFNAVAVEQNKVAIMYYDDNGPSTQNNEVDADMVTAIASFLILHSGNHLSLDSRDIVSWMNPKVAPQILLLDIAATYDAAAAIKDPISIVTLYDSEQTRTADIPALYVRHGVRKLPVGNNLYFVITPDGLTRILDSVNAARTDFRTRVANLSQQATSTLAKVKTDASGRAWSDD